MWGQPSTGRSGWKRSGHGPLYCDLLIKTNTWYSEFYYAMWTKRIRT